MSVDHSATSRAGWPSGDEFSAARTITTAPSVTPKWNGSSVSSGAPPSGVALSTVADSPSRMPNETDADPSTAGNPFDSGHHGRDSFLALGVEVPVHVNVHAAGRGVRRHDNGIAIGLVVLAPGSGAGEVQPHRYARERGRVHMHRHLHGGVAGFLDGLGRCRQR